MTSMKNIQFQHPLPPPLILFSVCPNGSESDKTPRRSWTSTLRLPTTPIPISFGILAKNCIGKSPKYTQCKAVIYNEKRHVKSSNMSTVLIRLLQIIRNCSKQESVYVFNLYFCSSVFVSELILIVIISIQLNECWISKQFEDVDNRSCNFTGTCFFLYNLSPIHYHTRHCYCDRPDTSLEHLQKNQTPFWNIVWTLMTLILIRAVGIQFLWIPSPSPL